MDPAAPESDDVISADRIRVRFGTMVAVRDVSFRLGREQLLGLIGPNGAGKTTLLRAIAGLQPLSRGSVHVLGRPVVPGAGEVLRDVGFTPDTPPLYDSLTVRQFLLFIAMGYGLTAADAGERIDFWLEKVWLMEKAGKKIGSLSRGMRQRVGIARTLLPNPHAILLDEPAAGLDPAGRVQFRQLLCDLRAQGKALIVSSHILSDMQDYCSHIGIMSRGSLVRWGTVAEVAHDAAATRCRYDLRLARHVDNLRDRLLEVDGVDGVEVNHERAVLQYDRNAEAAATLLAELIGLGLPIASFAPDSAGLEAAYLRAGIEQVD